MHGTLVNGVAIQPQTPRVLSEGDVIEIGDYKLTIQSSSVLSPSSAHHDTQKTQTRKAPARTEGERPAPVPAARTSVKKGKGGLISIVIILAVAAIGAIGWFMAPSLITQHNEEKERVRTEFVQSLTVMSQEAVDRIDAQRADLDQEIADTELKLQQLMEVVDQARAWVDLRKQEAETAGHSWTARATAEEMSSMKNDQYQVTTLEGKATSSGTFDAVIKVTDLTTSVQAGRFWEDIEEELTFLQSSLSGQKQSSLQIVERANATLQNIIQVAGNWEIDQFNGNTYTISGPRLGWSDDLTTGTWTYNRDTGDATPSDTGSLSLEKILNCEQ